MKPRVLVTVMDGVATAYVEGDVDVIIADYDTESTDDHRCVWDRYGNQLSFENLVTKPEEDFDHLFELYGDYFQGERG